MTLSQLALIVSSPIAVVMAWATVNTYFWKQKKATTAGTAADLETNALSVLRSASDRSAMADVASQIERMAAASGTAEEDMLRAIFGEKVEGSTNAPPHRSSARHTAVVIRGTSANGIRVELIDEATVHQDVNVSRK